MYLHNDLKTFEAAVARTANELRLDPAVVAKDYFVYVALREITARYPDAVFKGGTSLSKCHKAISRFSEDVDLGVEVDRLSQGEHKKVKAAVTGAMEALGLSIPNIGETRSRRDYNKYVVELPYDVGAPGLSSDLIIETAFMTPVAPAVRLPVGCLIGECYSELVDGAALLGAYDLAPFETGVTSIERAFADKAFALCDYYLGERSADRCSRHVYDEFKLLGKVKLDDEMRRLFAKVRRQRSGLPYCVSADPSVDVAATLREIAETRYYEHDYRNVTQTLLWERVPYEEAATSLMTIADFADGIDWDT